ncbi:DNA polymerase III subunit alpha [Frischella perrara]|uniref:DNA polymerase III subunit alpha n=1 Tax=Frischella perrara TaxID=1267021 RepID=A0A0A7S9V6_FRIPE|nr:DNA polymerase III subunit alpha [Frischella perrara]AJA46126.1 DNA-directed DNA polymerase III (polc) [Frischella perrara]MCT6876270.1 DNA polymerase III subunit alpha [Frischella perrara]PWV61997.1 DNA polymerase III alpha subunit [Frischella perrara]PXY94028.1 DNA polymerase III subunit alpha [Frischella perrara]
MSDPKFIHLHVHSDFSMLDGMAKTDALVKQTVAMNMPALAITDFSNLCGLVKFYGSALSKGIKPIIGADLKIHDVERDEFYDITVLAANNEGYHNLTLLISHAYQRGYVGDGPVVDKEWLIKYKTGLIILVSYRSDIGLGVIRDNQAMIMESIQFYQTHFADACYLELIRTGRENEELFVKQALKLAEQHDLPVVATNDVRFLSASDFEAHEIRVAIHDGDTLDDPKRPKKYSLQQYFRSESEMVELFSDIPESLINSVEIAKRCNVSIRLGEYFLPQFPTGEMTTEDFLIHKAQQGLEERLQFLFPDPDIRQANRHKYDERLAIELDVINQMGFPGYFLIVMEFIQWSKDNSVPVGPGRGSGAGSLVAYALKITDLDPLEFDLLFERFLNPERVSMPDFDVDFCMDKRDLVIDHVAEMYGRDAVSQIITFGTMAAKAVIRDVGRVLGHPYGFVDRISKLIPPDPGMTLAKAFEAEPRLLELYNNNEDVKGLIDIARQLEGVTRNAGKHAGGVVISPTKITDFAPIYCDAEGHHPVTQFDKNDVEYAGLVKFDFLGLRTLTIIDWAISMINERLQREGNPPVDINRIPLDDKDSFDLLLNAETTAVFQLESRGMKDLIRRLKPDCFEDMIALVALFRPGPLQSGMVDNFIDRKHGLEEVSYPDSQYQHESLKPILEPTYGIILYQEQVMQIAQTLAGYTLGGADLLRRAMGKKKPEEMAKQRSVFKEGAEKQGINGELSMKIFDLVEKFAGYGFNKSHSAAYALVSYQTLWLKTHFPAEFMAAVMTADMDNTDKIVGLVDECLRMGIKVNPPDINSGLYHFHVNDKGEIVYGIGAIKGVGEGPIEAIVEARNKQGKQGYFRNIFELCAKTDIKKLNRRVLEKLTMAGAFDKIGPHRAAILHSINDAIQAADQHAKAQDIGQEDMFGVLAEEPEQVEYAYGNVPKMPEQILLDGEREALGLYLTGHPVTQYLKELSRYTNGARISEATPTGWGKMATFAGLVITARIRLTKKGNRIGLFTLDDRSGRIEVMVFGETLEKFEHHIVQDKILIVTGQVSTDDFNGGVKLAAREIVELSEAREKYVKGLGISLRDSEVNRLFLQQLQKNVEPHRNGVIPVNVYYQTDQARVRIQFGTTWRVTPNDNLLISLKSLLGNERVELEFD